MTAHEAWTVERDADRIAWLTIDKPGTSVNVLSQSVLFELDDRLDALSRDPPRALVVLSAKASGFIGGADIKEFTAIRNEEDGYRLIRADQHVMDRLEALPFPTVAAIEGFALGGGLELALACRYRVAVGDERLSLGFPEVQLGICPGFGGTVRSVRLVGVRPAMELLLTGRPIRAEKALAQGWVDRLVSSESLRTEARNIASSRPRPHTAPGLERILSWGPARPLVRKGLLARVAKQARREHYPAPYAIIDQWARHGANGAASFEGEARTIAHLFMTDASRGLVRVFLLQDRLKGLGGTAAADIKHVHVVGAGVMGGDIAAWAALRGFTVTLQDRALEYIEPALARAAELFTRRVKDPAQRASTQTRLRADVNGDGVAGADVLIEAIFEDLEAKRALYSRLEAQMKPTALLGTNTSSIRLEPLAERLARPQRLVGLHFFNPVAQMPLIEVVHSSQTDEPTAQRAVAFARRLDKLPVPCRSAPGFVVNRVLMPYLHEAMYAAQEGVPLTVIDAAAVAFGMPMGPVELADVVGLDVASHVGAIVAAELGRPAPAVAQLESRVAAGKLGRKTGEGFYVWQDGKAVRPAIPPAPAPPDLSDRLILALVNECMACLREQIVADADLLDAAVIFGTGFAPFRGGPLFYANTRGIAAVVARLEELTARYGPRFEPDAGWARLLAEGKA